MNKKIVIAGVVLLASIVIGWLYFSRTDTPVVRADAPIASNAKPAPSPAPSNSVEVKTAEPKPAIKRPTKSAIYVEYENAPSLRDFFAKYSVDSAPAEGKFLAAKIALDDCLKFSFGYKVWRDGIEQRLKDDSPLKGAQKAAIANIDQKCGGDWAGTPPTKERGAALLSAASSAGSQAAAAYLLADDVQKASVEELSAKLGQMLSSNDFATIDQAMRAILAIGQRIGTIPLADGATANPFLFTRAWQLAECDLGQNCGPDSLAVIGYCAAGSCDAGSLDDYIRLHASTAAEYQEITRLRQLIVNSLSSGNKENLGLGVLSRIKR